MTKKKISVYFLFIAFFTSITVFSIIVQKSYSNLLGSNQNDDVTSLTNKINPNLDTSIIDEIENHPEYVDSGEINFLRDDNQNTGLSVISSNEASPASSSKQTDEE